MRRWPRQGLRFWAGIKQPAASDNHTDDQVVGFVHAEESDLWDEFIDGVLTDDELTDDWSPNNFTLEPWPMLKVSKLKANENLF